jgi:hypothetical protein
MTLHVVCDYCGEPIDDNWRLSLHMRGYMPRNTELGWSREDNVIGDFHSRSSTLDEPSCYDRVNAAIELAISWGPTLETIETATPQWVGAQRRRMKGGER